MGIYLQVEDKQAWLEKNATEVPLEDWSWELRAEGMIPLCFIRQYLPGGSILVCYFKDEVARAMPRLESDTRRNKYFYAPTARVLNNFDHNMVDAMKEDMADGFPEDSVFHEDGFPLGYENA